MTVGIYRLIFEGTDKCYVGQSVIIEKRYLQHLRKLELGTAPDKLQNAYANFGRPILDILLDDLSINDLNSLEEEAIEIFDSVHNGFNTHTYALEAPNGRIFGIGNHKYSKEQILDCFFLLVNTTLTYSEVSNKIGVSLGVVSGISSGALHVWLQEEFPKEYIILKSKVYTRFNSENVSNKLSAKSKGIVYPECISPYGTVYKVENAYAFAKIHGLAGNHFQEVLNGHRKSHKGWRVHK